jgi:hypothetical protein
MTAGILTLNRQSEPLGSRSARVSTDGRAATELGILNQD